MCGNRVIVSFLVAFRAFLQTGQCHASSLSRTSSRQNSVRQSCIVACFLGGTGRERYINGVYVVERVLHIMHVNLLHSCP